MTYDSVEPFPEKLACRGEPLAVYKGRSVIIWTCWATAPLSFLTGLACIGSVLVFGNDLFRTAPIPLAFKVGFSIFGAAIAASGVYLVVEAVSLRSWRILLFQDCFVHVCRGKVQVFRWGRLRESGGMWPAFSSKA